MSQAISAGITAANQYNQTGREAKGDSLGKSDFLLLLVTQFKYQDPLNPMDDKEFVAQLAQFSSLEQLMNLNTGMESLTDASKEQQLMSAANYIGKDVAASGNSVAKKDGHVGKMFWAVDGDMAKGAIYVFDAEKNQIYAENLSPTAGYTTNEWEWDGRNYLGALVPDGVYYITISAEDANGQTLLVDYRVTGRVEGVATEGGETYLRLDDGRVVALKNVKEIAAAKTLAEDPDPTDPDPDPNPPGDPGDGSGDPGDGTGP